MIGILHDPVYAYMHYTTRIPALFGMYSLYKGMQDFYHQQYESEVNPKTIFGAVQLYACWSRTRQAVAC